jgi:predicted naringenin-chalcone synthase
MLVSKDMSQAEAAMRRVNAGIMTNVEVYNCASEVKRQSRRAISWEKGHSGLQRLFGATTSKLVQSLLGVDLRTV